MIKERICSYEVAKLLQEKGFDEDCDYFYEHSTDEPHEMTRDEIVESCNLCIKAPTHQMACDYVFETYGLWICPNLLTVINKDGNGFKTEKVVWTYDVISATTGKFFYEDYEDGERKEYASQYEATEAGIKYSLENLV